MKGRKDTMQPKLVIRTTRTGKGFSGSVSWDDGILARLVCLVQACPSRYLARKAANRQAKYYIKHFSLVKPDRANVICFSDIAFALRK